jgi:DnaJ like chaperone protein
MGIWARVGDMVANGAEAMGSAVVGVFAELGATGRRRRRRQAAFAIAMIALSAKMAKADGVVTRAEIEAFRQIFIVPKGQERNVTRLFNLARRDVAGFELYARRVARLFRKDPAMLQDILDGLFHIAKADGAVHPRELAYLQRVAEIFGFDEDAFAMIRDRHVRGAEADPYRVLGADPRWDLAHLRRHYRMLVAENHPDRLIARGVPPECVHIATSRMAVINSAWERIERSRAPARP